MSEGGERFVQLYLIYADREKQAVKAAPASA